jgi:hypothetical protein
LFFINATEIHIMFESLKRAKKAESVECCSEYVNGHWIVLIRNAGHEKWIPVLDHSRILTDYDAFGDAIRTRPAVMTFESKQEADGYIKDNVGLEAATNQTKRVPARDPVHLAIGTNHSGLPEHLSAA